MILGYIGVVIIGVIGAYQIYNSVKDEKAGKKSRRIVGIIEAVLASIVVYFIAILMFTSVYLDTTTNTTINETVTQLEPLKLIKNPDPEYSQGDSRIYVQLASSRRDRGGFYIVATQDTGEKFKLPIPETQIFFRPEGSLLTTRQYIVKDTLMARLLGVSNKIANVTYTIYVANEAIDLVTNPDASVIKPYPIFPK